MRWPDYITRFFRRRWKWTAVVLILTAWYLVCLPDKIFDDSYSTVLFAKNGELLSATIAGDAQWRFPPSVSVNEKYREAVVAYEDKRFAYHPGVDPLAFGRAIILNLRSGKIVSGGSTLSMQVIRLSRKGRDRTILEKLRELILATRLELRYTKDEILNLYASHAPFGGNVVGLEAACWRYFGRSDKQISWGEAALLAVLPNSPALIHPGRNRVELRRKRDSLLAKLFMQGRIDSLTSALARAEPLPGEPVALPRHARHLLGRFIYEGQSGRNIVTTLDYALQRRVDEILNRSHERLKGNQIHNAAAIVAEVESGHVLAYVGNVGNGMDDAIDVDIIHAKRSTGSILKPFLFAAMLDEGKILPASLVPDIPTFINGFAPKNFSHDYDGAVPADEALIRSLNIPAVHMLKDYRYERFHGLLRNMGMQTLDKPADHYGLSLILGGAEGTLWDITGMYASMARTLNRFNTYGGKNRYHRSDFHPLSCRARDNDSISVAEPTSWLSASAVYHTFDALKDLYRPGEETGWRYFAHQKKVAWKTGTSFGFRDGWAIGVTPEYVVGVWVGNADGEGRPGLIGSEAAAPVLFQILAGLNCESWFTRPEAEMTRMSVCAKSGLRTSTWCPESNPGWVTSRALQALPCHFHKRVHLSADGRFQVNNLCAGPSGIRASEWFVLPPAQEYYYRRKHASYRPVPPFGPGCGAPEDPGAMDFIYPKAGSKFFIPRDNTGKAGQVIFQLAHRSDTTAVYWHLDGTYVGNTRKIHLLALNPPEGRHRLMVIDDSGAILEQDFEVLPRP